MKLQDAPPNDSGFAACATGNLLSAAFTAIFVFACWFAVAGRPAFHLTSGLLASAAVAAWALSLLCWVPRKRRPLLTGTLAFSPTVYLVALYYVALWLGVFQ